MEKRMQSDTKVQREMEEILFYRLKEILGCESAERNPRVVISEENNVWICPNFYSEEERVIGEIHTHVGKLKVAQQNKLKGDILKMLLLDESRNGEPFRKILAVCDREEYQQLQGKSFLAEAIRRFEVELIYIELTDEQRERIMAAMREQNLML